MTHNLHILVTTMAATLLLFGCGKTAPPEPGVVNSADNNAEWIDGWQANLAPDASKPAVSQQRKVIQPQRRANSDTITFQPPGQLTRIQPSRLSAASAETMTQAVAKQAPAIAKPAAQPVSQSVSQSDRSESLANTIKSLPANTGLMLPKPTVVALDRDLERGPPGRDYSIRMVYSPKRNAALYLGASHNRHKRNDVWEYHLASNTWQQLFPSDGGDHYVLWEYLKSDAWRRRNKSGYSPTADDRSKFAAAQRWWKNNVSIQNGRLTTTLGGPVLPFHTWDAVVFDESIGKLLWAVGPSWGGTAEGHAVLTGQPLPEVQAKLNPGLVRLWSFDPETQQYEQLQAGDSAGVPEFRGMGASMVYLPDKQQSIFYVAAGNVTPGEFGMYRFDAEQNRWQSLNPNGGRSVKKLAFVDRVAPKPEQQMAYSEKHQKLVAVRSSETFVYDLNVNIWRKVASDKRVNGHDNKSVFVYDSSNDVFLLANPRNRAMPLAEFSLDTMQWRALEPKGELFPTNTLYGLAGYWDPEFEVMVVRYGRENFWVYRR